MNGRLWFRRPQHLKHVFHLVIGEPGPQRHALVPPPETSAYLYFDAATETDQHGKLLRGAQFWHHWGCIQQQAHRDRRDNKAPQSVTVVIDNAASAVDTFVFYNMHWHRVILWILFDTYEQVPDHLLRAADHYYLFQEKDVRAILAAIPPSRRGVNAAPDHLPKRAHEKQCWVISRWRRGVRRPSEGALGWTSVTCFEAPIFGVIRRAIRRRLWRRWMREWVVMRRFTKRFRKIALARAYAPGGLYSRRAVISWNCHLQSSSS